ncbi:MAG: nickel-responsive transcriptional regulator NikR [Gammaproteobacteria bacterium]|nr:nickel-responsive transcriptional regulator NikR [Gammaproteobacteria bacterium]
MERFTMSLEDDLAKQFDELIKKKGYSNRSEAMRDIIRHRLQQEELNEKETGHCVASLSYVYNHHESELAGRITSAHHSHHDLTLSTMHVHLDHDNCLEIVVLKGETEHVKEFANTVMAVRGVRHGDVHMVPIEIEESTHGPHGHTHTHVTPKS